MPFFWGQPHCPFLEEEQPETTRLVAMINSSANLNSFCIIQVSKLNYFHKYLLPRLHE